MPVCGAAQAERLSARGSPAQAAPARDPPASAPKTKKARRRRGRDPGQVPGADDMEETPAETAQAREGEPWRKPEAIGEHLAV